MTYDTLTSEYELQDKAKKALKKMKELEKGMCMHVFKIDERTTVCCKNKENIQRYIKQ